MSPEPSPLLIAILGIFYGANAVWFAFPIADGIVLILVLLIVVTSQRHGTNASGFGLSDREDAI